MKRMDYKSEAYELTKKLLFYPMILLFCWVWGSINRIILFGGENILWLHGMHVFMGGSMGFLNFLGN